MSNCLHFFFFWKGYYLQLECWTVVDSIHCCTCHPLLFKKNGRKNSMLSFRKRKSYSKTKIHTFTKVKMAKSFLNFCLGVKFAPYFWFDQFNPQTHVLWCSYIRHPIYMWSPSVLKSHFQISTFSHAVNVDFSPCSAALQPPSNGKHVYIVWCLIERKPKELW